MADIILPTVQDMQSSRDRERVYERHVLHPRSTCIRVLDVRPIPKDATEDVPLECAIRVIDLALQPDFTALSYVWGDPNDTWPMMCDNTLFEVTKNCYSALWNLSKKLGGLAIWVDAVCIDQRDKNNEKEWQIPLMGEIYTKAKQVYVWLGKGDERSDRVMRHLSRGGFRAYVQFASDDSPRYRPYAAALRIYLARWSLTYHPYQFQGKSKPLIARISRNVEYSNWDNLVYLLDRPWKDRLWTYQEILLASHPVVVCGTEHLEWSDFEWALLLLRATATYFPSAAIAWESIVFERARVSSTVRPTEPNVLHSLLEHEAFVKKIVVARQVWKTTWPCLLLLLSTTFIVLAAASTYAMNHPGQVVRFRLTNQTTGAFFIFGVPCFIHALNFIIVVVLPMYRAEYRGDIMETAVDDLVGALYQRAATDPRDMAYGIWAILRKRGAQGLPDPTYENNKENQIPVIYRQLTVHLTKVTSNLRFLHLAAATRLPKSPSWVPDWSTFKSNTWGDLPGFPGTDIYAIQQVNSSEDKARLKKYRAHQRISIDPTQSILTVLARDTGAIRSYVTFHAIGGALEMEERRAHMENLRGMLQWATWTESIGCKIAATYFTKPGRSPELTPLSAVVTWPSQKDRLSWLKVFSGSKRNNLNTYLTSWMDGAKVPSWFSKFMATQTCLCTFIAETKRKICYVSLSAKPGKFYLLACARETEVDDRVISVCGLPGFIVMRKCGNLDNSVELVSPSLPLGAENNFWHPRITHDGGSIPLERQFVEYNIH